MSTSQKKEKPLHSLIAGSTAGSVEGKFVNYPWDFIKTRAQFEGKRQGPVEIVRETIKERGVTGLYSGCMALVIGNAAKAGVRFLTYDHFKHLLADDKGRITAPRSLLAGLGAGMAEAIIAVTPSETIKTKLIDDAKRPVPQYKGLIDGTSRIIKAEGIAGIYRGLFPVMMRQGANSAVRFSTYSSLKAFVQGNARPGQQLPPSITFTIGAIAGLITTYVTQPLDVIKTRMQSLEARQKYKTSFHCAYVTYRDDGLLRFWAGTTPRLMRLIISGGITFSVYEHLLSPTSTNHARPHTVMTAIASPKTIYFDAVYETLPITLKEYVDILFAKHASTGGIEARHTFDRLLRLLLGGNRPEGDVISSTEWIDSQTKLELALSSLDEFHSKGKKRGRDDDSSEQNSKKVKLDSTMTPVNCDQEDFPIYSLHAISVISPIRKKVDITLHQRSIRFTSAASGSLQSVIPTESLTRAFLLSTPKKTKPHWTVIILSDTEHHEIIYGVDDVLPSLKTTIHPRPSEISPKGTSVEASLRTFLSHLPSHIPLLELSTSQFRSGTGEPWLGTFLRAKDGYLFLFQSGILFGLRKPCTWIGMEEIEGVRSLSVTGRTFSIFIKRRLIDEDQNGEGAETVFSMVDGKHQDSVSEWIQDNRHLFGVNPNKCEEHNAGENQRINTDLDESDDSDYRSESESDDGEPTSDSDEDTEDSTGDSDGSEEEDTETEAEAENEEANIATGNEKKTLDPSWRPVVKVGVVQQLSKAAMDAVIGTVERDLKGGLGRPQPVSNEQEIDELGDDDDDEVDQLE
ncbi:hypothetical protein Clacol_000261 [Clathrus columnatus]|uniref:Histone chaperone RTT106/FACT complex subunit SPT16-like middle domain-containing protein n=1 Tax=Clathrus columnatus TaxID=1419009 RepID=A0AAV4ZYC4_9AGAM|nr:hypothetical protein Clacol_000261 [Clathrus columnatus]